MIENAIETAFRVSASKGWLKTYWAVDIHDTMIYSNYSSNEIPKTFYPNAKECLQLLSANPHICLILFTCSHNHEIEKYQEYFKSNGINFQYVNSNPEVVTDINSYGCYDSKFYANVILDDKAGFNANEDWKYIIALLTNNNQFNPTDWNFKEVKLNTWILVDKIEYRIQYNVSTNHWSFYINDKFILSTELKNKRTGDTLIKQIYGIK